MGPTSGRVALACGLILAGCSGRDDEGPGRAAVSADSSQPATPNVAPADTAGSKWQIVPDRTTGPLTRETNEADLRQRYGAAVVDSARIQIGEGETMAGTVLYPWDSLQRMEIIWQDSIHRRRPARLILRGSQSRWQVYSGISLGTSLQELERLNGKPFTLAGFGWDYAGVVTDWKGGSLEGPLRESSSISIPGPLRPSRRPTPRSWATATTPPRCRRCNS